MCSPSHHLLLRSLRLLLLDRLQPTSIQDPHHLDADCDDNENDDNDNLGDDEDGGRPVLEPPSGSLVLSL